MAPKQKPKQRQKEEAVLRLWRRMTTKNARTRARARATAGPSTSLRMTRLGGCEVLETGKREQSRVSSTSQAVLWRRMMTTKNARATARASATATAGSFDKLMTGSRLRSG